MTEEKKNNNRLGWIMKLVLSLTYGCSTEKIFPEFAQVNLLAGYWQSWSSSVFVNWTIWPGHYREEKCDVMLSWLRKFWTSTIFLDRDGNLQWKEWAIILSLRAIMHRKFIHVNFLIFFSVIFAGPQFVEIHGTWRNDFSSLRPFFKGRLLFLQSKWDSCKAVTPSFLTPREIAASIMCFSSEKRVLAV